MQQTNNPHPALAAFPHRRLRLRGKVMRAATLALFGLVVLGGLLTFGATVVLPDIRTDLMLRETALPNGSVRIQNGRCRSKLAVLHDCSARLSWRDSAGSHVHEAHYMFITPHLGNWSVTPMTDPEQPGLVTTDMGLDHLNGRVAVLGGFSLLMLGLSVAAVLRLYRVVRESRLMRTMSEADLVPVASKLKSASKTGWTIVMPDGGKHTWLAVGGADPFMLDEAQGLVLALQPRAGGVAFPLDDEMKRVDLTADERARILSAAT